MFQWKAHNHVLIHPHLPIWHPFIKPDQLLDPLIKNQMKTNALSTIFTDYGKPNVDEPFNYRYPKVIMHISVIELSMSIIESWIYPYISQTWMSPLIIDIYPKVIMDIRNWIINIYNWIMDPYLIVYA